MTSHSNLLKLDPLKPGDAISLMQELGHSADIEAAHGEADDILCRALRGACKYLYTTDEIEALIRAYDAVEKWYA